MCMSEGVVVRKPAGMGKKKQQIQGEKAQSKTYRLKKRVELGFGFCKAFFVGAVTNVNDGVCVLVIVLPQGADLGLATNVPNSHVQRLVLHRLNVESNRWDRSNHLPQLHLVQAE